MRNWRWSLGVLVLWLATSASANARQQPIVEQSGSVNVQVNVGPSTYGGGQEHILDLKVMLGLPTAVRVQVPFDRGPDFSYSIEGTVGIFPDYFTSSPFYALGGRASYTLSNNFIGGHLLLNPGVDLAYFTGSESTLAATGSVEFLWLSEFNSHLGLELGVDAGVGIGIVSFDNVDRSGFVFPVISAFGGIRF
jgi:hypothetical protein